MSAWPHGLWYIEIQRSGKFRGDERQTTEDFFAWIDAAKTPEGRAARVTFADGFLFGMKWSGAWPVRAEEASKWCCDTASDEC